MLTGGVDESEEIQHRLDDLGEDPAAVASRIAVCRTIGEALAHVGRLLWVTGYIVGPDRKSGASPFKFGDDAVVGVATVAQVGGQLTAGVLALLEVGNLYAASALIRQLVEIEYLAFAFAEEHDIAAQWLRATREERRAFWSPAKLRERANGIFLASDYWHHCDLGGHPTTRGMLLLPDHKTIHPAYLWVDLAGHLVSIWKSVVVSTERLLGGPIPNTWKVPDVSTTVEAWHTADGLNTAMRDFDAI